MLVFVMRHGHAVFQHHNDEGRPLSDSGKTESAQSAKWINDYLQAHNSNVSMALISPYVRAQQTFAQISQVVNVANKQTIEDIIPAGNSRVAREYIEFLGLQNEHIEAILVVSHMPLVSYLLDELCGQSLSHIFSTGTVVCVDFDIQRGGGDVVDVFNPLLN